VPYYSSKDKLSKDFQWLAKECSLEHFTFSRLSDYELVNLTGQIKDRIDNAFVEDFFNQFLSKVNLQSSPWEDTIERNMLPMLALIPGAGVQVIIDIGVNGAYKLIGLSGSTEAESFPQNTIFRVLRFRAKSLSLSSSGAMFKAIAKKHTKYLKYAFIASISINTLALAIAFYTMQVYDRVISTNGISTLIALTIGVGIALLLEFILKISRSAIIDQASKSMDIEFSHKIFERFLSLRLDSMPPGIGTLSSKINSYVSVRDFITSVFPFIFIDFPFAFVFLGVITLLGGIKIGLLMFAFLIAAILVGLLFNKKIIELTKASTLASHKKHGLLVESVTEAIKIKTSGASWSVMNKWNQHTDDAVDDELAIKHYTELSGFLAILVQQSSYVSTIALGAYLIGSTSDLTMGSLIAITILANKVFQPMTMIPGLYVKWAKTKVAIEDLDGLYKMPQDNENVDRPITAKMQSYKIQCKDIKFAYEKDSYSLNIPNLQIQEGEKVAILGVIGAGKSTLLKILSGIFKPSVGKVALGGIDMQQISRDNISNTLGYLDQDTKLFAGTLRDNLTLGLVNITDEHIIKVSEKTGLINLISTLPKGLDSKVPEGGQRVSGGQRQLIALTRMLIADSKILLFDEPTASMDDATENYVLSMLKENLTKEQTAVFVTHKPRILDLVDRIIILTEQGIIADDKKEVILKQLKDNEVRSNVNIVQKKK
jgi:ATP-binding cassette subfamily C protein LapB